MMRESTVDKVSVSISHKELRTGDSFGEMERWNIMEPFQGKSITAQNKCQRKLEETHSRHGERCRGRESVCLLLVSTNKHYPVQA